MMKLIYISIFLSAIILMSCEKNNDYNKKSEISIGANTDMIVNYYDTTLIGEYNYALTYNLDIDNNGIDDIQFTSEVWGSPAVGGNPKSMVLTLHKDVEFSGAFKNDTSFINSSTYIYDGPDNTFEMVKYVNHTCNRFSETDSVVRITPSFKLDALNKNDKLRTNDIYNTDTIVLQDDMYSFPPTDFEQIGDTLCFEYHTYYNNCNSFPMDEIKYIGVKLHPDSRLGWIKLSVFDKYKVLILESGIQK